MIGRNNGNWQQWKKVMLYYFNNDIFQNVSWGRQEYLQQIYIFFCSSKQTHISCNPQEIINQKIYKINILYYVKFHIHDYKSTWQSFWRIRMLLFLISSYLSKMIKFCREYKHILAPLWRFVANIWFLPRFSISFFFTVKHFWKEW